MRPIDAVIGNRWPRGIFRAYAETVPIAPAANAIIAAFRWADLQRLATAMRVWVNVNVATAVTAQRTDPLRLYFARNYTVRDSTNATAVTISAAMQKVRTNMLDSLLVTAAGGNFDVANAAAGLAGGTKTTDTNPIGSKAFSQQALAGLGTGMEGDIYVAVPEGDHPPVLQTQVPGGGEGLLLFWGPTALATGTVTVGIGIEWAESTVV